MKDKDQPNTNLWYLVAYTVTLGISSSEYGFVMASPSAAAKALRYQLNWGDDPMMIDFYFTIL